MLRLRFCCLLRKTMFSLCLLLHHLPLLLLSHAQFYSCLVASTEDTERKNTEIRQQAARQQCRLFPTHTHAHTHTRTHTHVSSGVEIGSDRWQQAKKARSQVAALFVAHLAPNCQR